MDRAVATASPQDWNQLIPQLRLTGLAEQLALHSKLEKDSERHWIIKVDPSQRSLLGGQSEWRLRERLQQQAGKGVQISIEASSDPIDTPFKWQQKQISAQMAQAKQDLKHDPVMNDIMDAFGVDLDQAIIQPLD